MKVFLLAALVLAAACARADGDQETVVLKCRNLQMVADNNYSITLSEGGLTGHMSLRVENSTFIGAVVRNYFVDQKAMIPIRMGAPVVYAGPKVRLSVNYTTAPIQGGHYGTIEERNDNGSKNVVTLVCKNFNK